MNKELIVLQLHYYLKGENNHSMDASIHNECERYFEYNKNLLFDERRADILSRLDRLGAF